MDTEIRQIMRCSNNNPFALSSGGIPGIALSTSFDSMGSQESEWSNSSDLNNAKKDPILFDTNDQKCPSSPSRRRICSLLQALSRSSVSNKAPIDPLIDACKKDPSVGCIMSLVERSPESLSATNLKGQTALHVAAAKGASSKVIMYLAGQFPQALSQVDNNSRLPLHYLAQSSNWVLPGARLFERIQECMVYCDPHYLEMVRMCCVLNPNALVQEDKRGKTPIDYALEHEAPMEVIKTLQLTSQVNLQKGICKKLPYTNVQASSDANMSIHTRTGN